MSGTDRAVLLIPLVGTLLLAVAVVEMVRRRRLREDLSWLWVLGVAGALTLSVWPLARNWLAGLLGTGAPVAVLVAGCFFLALVCLCLSTRVGRLVDRQEDLAREVAHLGQRLADLDAGRDPGDQEPAGTRKGGGLGG